MALFLGVHDLNKDMGSGWEGYKKVCAEIGCRVVNASIPLEDVFEVNRSG